ncbi:hypothetical protein Gpo141_00010688 [Globisporangium polare]
MQGLPCFNQIELPNYVRSRHLKTALFGILDNSEFVSGSRCGSLCFFVSLSSWDLSTARVAASRQSARKNAT